MTPDSPGRVPRVDTAGRVRMVPTPKGWRGVRVSTQAEADAKIPLLLGEPAELRFVWVEPAEAVDLRQWLPDPFSNGTLAGYWYEKDPATPRVRWLIVFGQCGPTAWPLHPEWVRSLRDQAKAAGVPFLFVGWGEWRPYCSMTEADGDALYLPRPDGGDPEAIRKCRVDTVSITPYPMPRGGPCDLLFRVGKRAAGRLLDGVTHDAIPQPTKGGTR